MKELIIMANLKLCIYHFHGMYKCWCWIFLYMHINVLSNHNQNNKNFYSNFNVLIYKILLNHYDSCRLHMLLRYSISWLGMYVAHNWRIRKYQWCEIAIRLSLQNKYINYFKSARKTIHIIITDYMVC